MTSGKDTPVAMVRFRDLRLSRRTLLRGFGIGGAGLLVSGFVGCGDDDDDTAAETTTTSEGTTGTTAEAEAPAEVEQTSYVYGFPAPHAAQLYVQYIAQGMGFWEEEGLEVTIEYQTAGIQLLAGGTVDYGEVSCDELLNATAAGQAVTAFYQPYYGQNFNFRVPVDSPITEWTTEQLTGKTIGITELAGGEVPITRAALKRIGLTEGDNITLYPTSGASQAITVDAFNTGTIHVFSGSILDHAAVETAGLELRDITPQFVLDASGDNASGCRTDYLEENRDQVVRLGRGLAKAKTWALANPEDGLTVALEKAPETGTREEVKSFVDIALTNRAYPPEEAGIEEGEIWIQGWDNFQKLLLEGGTGSPDDPLTFSEPLDITTIADNSLRPEIWDFDRAEIEARTR